MRDSTDGRRSSDASLSDFVENFAHFADTESSLVTSPFVLSPSTMGSFAGRRVSLKSNRLSHHTRGRSSISLPGSVEPKRLTSMLFDNRSAQNSPRILPSQTLPPNTALPPIPAFRSLHQSPVSSSSFSIRTELEPRTERGNDGNFHVSRDAECSDDTPALSTMQAIRALAQSAPTLLEGPDVEEHSEEDSQGCEVRALRAALSYTLSRSDRLRASLAREQAEKRVVLNELAVLRANVLSILGKSVFRPPQETASRTPVTEGEEGDRTPAELPTQDDTRAILTKVTRLERKSPPTWEVQKDAEKDLPMPPRPTVSTGSVSISSLRKNAASPLGLGIALPITSRQQRSEGGSNDDVDSLTDMPTSPYKIDVSLTDFLNASRMTKTEIAERDSRFLSPGAGAEHWRNSSRSSSSLALEHVDRGVTASASPRISKFLRGISKKMETERQRIMQPSSSRRPSTFVLGETSSNTRLVSNSSVSSLGRNSSVYSSLAPSTATFHSYSTASANRRDKGRSSLSSSAFSEGPAPNRRVSRTPVFVESSIVPIQHIGRQNTPTGLVTS